jgi:hypothetical protein
MIKKLLNAALVILIAMIVCSLVGIMALDSMGRTLVKTAGSEGLGVPVTVKNVHVGFFSKSTHLKELKIANPEGFSEPTLLSIDRIDADFGIIQMFDKQVVIPVATVSGVHLDLEQTGTTSNIETVIKNIFADKTPEPENTESSFVIKTLRITNITVTASGKFTVLDRGSVTATIKEIVMHDIGTNSDGEVAIEAITSALTHAIMDHLSKHPAEGLSKLALSRVTGFINKLPIFKELGIGKLIQGVSDGLGKGVDGIIGGIGNLFGGDKKKSDPKPN